MGTVRGEAVLAIIHAMEMLPLAETRNRLSELIANLQAEQDQLVVSRNGRPAAVIVSIEEWEGIQETLAILADPEAVESLARGTEEDERGEVVRADEVASDIETAIRRRRDVA